MSKKATWTAAATAYFSQLVGEDGPSDYEKLARRMKACDSSWVFTPQQLRSRVSSMKKRSGGGQKRASSELAKQPAKKARRNDPLSGLPSPASPASLFSTKTR